MTFCGSFILPQIPLSSAGTSTWLPHAGPALKCVGPAHLFSFCLCPELGGTMRTTGPTWPTSFHNLLWTLGRDLQQPWKPAQGSAQGSGLSSGLRRGHFEVSGARSRKGCPSHKWVCLLDPKDFPVHGGGHSRGRRGGILQSGPGQDARVQGGTLLP